MSTRSLAEVVAQQPYPDFAEWWPLGNQFLRFMAEAICSEWQAIGQERAELSRVQADVATYIELVYQQVARPTLAVDFLEQRALTTIRSGEFDALSYAFYKSAFEHLAIKNDTKSTLATARHHFTQQVGRHFYQQLHEHLDLALPTQLQSAAAVTQLQTAIERVGDFLQQQGYLRTHFAFHFDVHLQQDATQIEQQPRSVVAKFQRRETVYALYEMGYPVILPSAVYLYQTIGEAQHHSSRTIEELFGRIGYVASETSDFDPTGYPSELVVELWEIHPQ